MQNSKIRDIKVHLVSRPITGGFADATRKVETVGFTVVRVITDDGTEDLASPITRLAVKPQS